MFRLWMMIAFGFLLLGTPSGLWAQADNTAKPSAEAERLVLPLSYRSPKEKVLIAMDNPREAELTQKFMTDRAQKFDFIKMIDPVRHDYSDYHLVILGSEGMRAFAQAEIPEDFDPLARFVANGGHLMIFGTFNGVNCAHLKRFGIKTGVQHALGFRTIPGRSEVLFHGVEEIVPSNHLTRSTGSFLVDGPHVAFLLRETTASLPDAPMVATLAFQKGRVTYTQVEPDYENNLWFLTTLLTWAMNGGPTVVEQLDQDVVLDQRQLAQRRRFPIPSEIERKSAEQAVRDKLRDDFAEADTLDKKRNLAERLVKLAPLEPDPVARFACLQLARESFAEVASPAALFSTVRQLQSQFQVDGTSLSVEAAKSFSNVIHDPVGAAELARECLDLADDLVDESHFDAAVSMASLAKDAAQTAKQKQIQNIATQALRRFSVLQKESDRIQPFRDTLQTDANNPQANTEVGKFLCLIVHDWDDGLPHLAKGDDSTLRQLAEAELKGTDDPIAQAALGDLWILLSGKLSTGMRSSARARAKGWYSRAISKMSGAERMKVERKAAKIVSEQAEIRLSVRDCGPAELHITKDSITWKQLSGEMPESAQFNSQYWPVKSQPELRNRGATRYFFNEVALETASLTKVRSRGVIELQSSSPELLVIRLDAQSDADFEIKFGQ